MKRLWLAPTLLAGLAGCEEEPTRPDGGLPPAPFVSADPDDGRSSWGPGRGEAPGGDNAGPGGEAQVVEGDIYRLLGDGRLLNLNPYRGLQVVDFRDPEAPAITGQLQVSGDPMEMYVAGAHAVVLLNEARGYYGARGDVLPDAWADGLVVVVDVSDPERPVERDRARVAGSIRTSRMVQGGGRSALYLASQLWADGASTTVARSFSLGADGRLTEGTRIDLGGDVADIQATPEVLLVARNDWNRGDGRSRVALVDISDPGGAMRLAGEVQVAGLIRRKFDMDLYSGVLRVVSSGRWGPGNANQVETFDASDLDRPVPIDRETFGAGQDLFATIFLGNKAFFVTYFRQDPFHAFEIDDDGRITERAEFVVSGWNDFFRPTSDQRRLIGIGVNDAQGRALAVSLYDITDLANPEPLVQRAEVGFQGSWSEALWDDRAFSVLEGVVDVPGPGGVRETGLVLLPFTGYDEDAQRHVSGVQVFSFSEASVTRRGVMEHGTPVRRSFEVGQAMPACLSNEALGFHDATDPDEPRALGSVELAPDFSDFFVVGDQAGVRLRDRRDAYAWWRGGTEPVPPSVLEVVPLDGDPDRASAQATVEVATGAGVYAVGRRLVSISARPIEPSAPGEAWQTESTLVVHDFSEPSAPREVGRLVTRELPPVWGGGWVDWEGGPMRDACYGCWGWGIRYETYAVGDVLAFVERVPQQQLVGQERICETRPAVGRESCAWDLTDTTCTFYGGGVQCRASDGQPEVCSGTVERCTWASGEVSCDTVAPETVPTEKTCWTWDRYRYWQSFRFRLLDLASGDAPRLGQRIEMPMDEEAASVLAIGPSLYLTYRRPVEVAGDPRPHVSWFFKRLDLSDPSDVRVDRPVSVPGEVVALEGELVYTRDLIWQEEALQTVIRRVRVQDGLATLQGSRRFDGEQVDAVRFDGAGHLLVSHRPAWAYGWGDAPVGVPAQDGGSVVSDVEPQLHSLTVLDATLPNLPVLADVRVDTWAELRDARVGRALFSVPGGLLVMNLDDAAHPEAQAWFPTRGWPQHLSVVGRALFVPGGRFGLFRFSLDDRNLPPRP